MKIALLVAGISAALSALFLALAVLKHSPREEVCQMDYEREWFV